MYSSRFFKISILIIIPILLILLFEWVNVKSQYEDQSMVETSIRVDHQFTAKQKNDGLEATYKTAKEMKNDVTIIKWLLMIFSLVLIFLLHQQNKLREKSIQTPTTLS